MYEYVGWGKQFVVHCSVTRQCIGGVLYSLYHYEKKQKQKGGAKFWHKSQHKMNTEAFEHLKPKKIFNLFLAFVEVHCIKKV